MWLMLLLSFIFIITGFFIFVFREEINLIEWAIGSVISIIISLIFWFAVIHGMTIDEEIISGKIINIKYEPRWIEEYIETHTTTDDKGNTSTYTTIEHRTHGPNWWYISSYGNSRIIKTDINRNTYNYLLLKFGKENKKLGDRPGFDGGDRYDYYGENINNWIEPVTSTLTFTNKIKAAPSVFSYVKVSDKIPVFKYPEEKNEFCTTRLLGIAKEHFDKRKFDLMNSRLGPYKRVNIIIIGFIDKDVSLAQYQEAKYVGGKKNDLVICYGWNSKEKKVIWSKVFGWTEKAIVKRNIESFFIDNKFNLTIKNDCDILLEITEVEIKENYRIKDWTKFDYITVEPPAWSYIVLIIVSLFVQIVLYFIFIKNEFNK